MAFTINYSTNYSPATQGTGTTLHVNYTIEGRVDNSEEPVEIEIRSNEQLLGKATHDFSSNKGRFEIKLEALRKSKILALGAINGTEVYSDSFAVPNLLQHMQKSNGSDISR